MEITWLIIVLSDKESKKIKTSYHSAPCYVGYDPYGHMLLISIYPLTNFPSFM